MGKLRNRRSWGILSIALAICIVLSTILIVSAPQQTEDVLLPASADGDFGIEAKVTYSDYILAEVTPSQKEALRRCDIDMVELRGSAKICLDSATIHTYGKSAKDISSNANEEKHSIIQFIGPVKQEWKNELEGMGISLHDYVPHFSYIAELNGVGRKALMDKEFVKWVEPFRPGYKVDPEAANADLVNLVLFDDDVSSISEEVERLDGEVLGINQGFQSASLKVRINANNIQSIAKSDSVKWIEPAYEDAMLSADASWVLESGMLDSTPVESAGITGAGEIIALADTGINPDHEMFADLNPIGDSHRKLQDYYAIGGGNLQDLSGHGTHAAGIIAGDADGPYDGKATGARLIVQDIGGDGETAFGSVEPPEDRYKDAFLRAYEAGSRVHSNSWGGGSGYTDYTRQEDAFAWNHKNFVIVFAIGNDAAVGSLSDEAEAKNIITVGGTRNGADSKDLYSDSSRGPSADGRLKPTIVAPAESVTSADGVTGGYIAQSGTSVAAPLVAGAATQIKQYFKDGWHTGARDTSKGFEPSSALVKAVMVNSADEISGIGTYENGEGFYPNNQQGWGKVTLDGALYFEGDSRKLEVRDERIGIETGESVSYDFYVDDVSQTLEITLVWTDYPAAAGVNPALVNDLDLKVTAPGGKVYLGNVFTGQDPGRSAPDAGSQDRLNVEESVLLVPGYNSMSKGEYTVTVSGFNVPNPEISGKQPFALAVTGGLDKTAPQFAGVRNAADQGTGGSVLLSWNAVNDAGPITYNIYRATSTPVSTAVPTYTGITGTTFEDTGLIDGQRYYYSVRAVDAAGNEDSNLMEAAAVPTAPPVTVSIPLHQGWNLVSIPVRMAVTGIHDVLSSIAGEYSAAQWYDASDPADPWKMWAADKPDHMNDLTHIDHTMGFWLYIDTAGGTTLDVTGYLAPTVLTLHAGWNMISYPSLAENVRVSQALSGLGVLSYRIKGYAGDEDNTQMLSEDSVLSPGSGYFIYVDQDCTWIVDW